MAKWSGQWHIDIGDSIPVLHGLRVHFVSFEARTGELIKKPIGPWELSYSAKRCSYELRLQSQEFGERR